MAKRAVTEQLLDAQVAFHLARLSGDTLQAEVADAVDDVLAALADVPLADVVDRDRTKAVVRRLVGNLPATAGASTLVSALADVIHDGPVEPVSLSELISREHVEALIDEALGFAPLLRRSLDELAESPLVATMASRFVGRIVGDVLAANRSVAEKIPGVGGLMSMGAGAASKVMGAADKQLEAVLGDTAGKGAAFAMRRLNKIVVDTLADPMTRDAALQVWDTYADEPIAPPAQYVTREDSQRLAGLAQEIAASAAPTEPVGALLDSLVDAFFDAYGEHPPTVLLDELEITRDDLVTDLGALAPGVVEALTRNGVLERAIRERLAPFYASAEVAAILAGP